MKKLHAIERKWFPHDSPYQRIRRRRAMFFGALGFFVLLYGTVRVITKFSSFGGESIKRTKVMKMQLPRR